MCGTKQDMLNYTKSKIFWKELPSLVARGRHHLINWHPVSAKTEIWLDFISWPWNFWSSLMFLLVNIYILWISLISGSMYLVSVCLTPFTQLPCRNSTKALNYISSVSMFFYYGFVELLMRETFAWWKPAEKYHTE